MTLPSRLQLDSAALLHNWRLLQRLSGPAACGAAVKADAYGLGAREVVRRLLEAGCRDFFVASWAEAAALADTGATVSVLHGVREEDMPLATRLRHARPVLNTPGQVARWRGHGACDVMVDTGMNRLGLAAGDLGLVEGLAIDTLLSHLASADEDSALNARQRSAFAGLAGQTSARRMSLANSAGIGLGADFAFDLTRPGLALYGGVPRAALGGVRQVVSPQAQVLQRRRVPAGQTVGYNALWTAPEDTEVAILNIGYADGYFRGFSDRGTAKAGDTILPVIGRVSMDLTAVNVSAAAEIGEGDWLVLDFALPEAAARSGMSQYELLTSLGARFERVWS
ncbi:alanine racemase [Sphingomonas aracearum]|uniref:alanine racemase n=1 Tax=Sphingomonas aracearum TaxID=2283317 RepID=A0A369VT19_9SPHN|nr:alanine racemase [Sphingomonas aracearum]RDE05554.1 alanine racemase [Sphingomonas aracearum]